MLFRSLTVEGLSLVEGQRGAGEFDGLRTRIGQLPRRHGDPLQRCIEGGGRPSGCTCTNPQHGYAIVDVRAMLPGDEPLTTSGGEGEKVPSAAQSRSP